MSTEEILRRLENLTIKEHKELICFVRQYTKSADAAEDFIQAAYLEAMRNLNRIDQPERFISWLKTVAKRKAIKEIDNYARLVKKYVDIEIEAPSTLENRWIDNIYLMDILCRVVKNYPSYYFQVLQYRDIYEMTYAQIADELGVTIAAARQAHSRLIRAMRKEIEKDMSI